MFLRNFWSLPKVWPKGIIIWNNRHLWIYLILGLFLIFIDLVSYWTVFLFLFQSCNKTLIKRNSYKKWNIDQSKKTRNYNNYVWWKISSISTCQFFNQVLMMNRLYTDQLISRIFGGCHDTTLMWTGSGRHLMSSGFVAST